MSESTINLLSPLEANLRLRIALLLILVVSVTAALFQLQPPTLNDAPGNDEFSVRRALKHLPTIARKPHPIASPENARVRQYLVDTLRASGLNPQVQRAFISRLDPWGVTAGVVHNVIVRLPGSIGGKAVVLTAHYDSVTTGPGAADNGASVAAVLETLRAVQAMGSLRNDVIAVFTDGEEVGLLGAQAFMEKHPWASDAGLVLNFEFRGNRGAALLFETSTGNDQLIAGYAQAVPHPRGSSLLYELYQWMPNDTDLSVFKTAGVPGLNIAAAEGHTSYHTALDRVELLDPASLQHLGETMLALLNHFGNADLERLGGSDRAFFEVPGLGMLSYPIAWNPVFCVFAVLMLAATLTAVLRSGAARGVRVLLAAPVFVLVLIVGAAVCQATWLMAVALHPEYGTLLQGDTYNSHWYLAAFVVLSLAMFSLAISALARWIGSLELMLGAMVVWGVLLCATAIWMPGASYLLLWPLASMLVGLLVIQSARRLASGTRMVLLSLAAVPGVLLFTNLIWMLFAGLGPSQSFVVVALLGLLLGLFAPVLQAISGRGAVRWVPLGLAAVLLGIGSVTSVSDSTRPRQDSLMYAQDGAAKKAYWLSMDADLDEWTGSVIRTNRTQRAMPEFFGPDSATFWTGTAPALLQPPLLETSRDHVESGLRTLELRIASRRQAERLMLAVEGPAVVRSSLDGRPLTSERKEDWVLDVYGIGGDELSLSIEIELGSPFRLRLIDVSNGLPVSLPARPPHLIPQPFMLNGGAMAMTDLRG